MIHSDGIIEVSKELSNNFCTNLIIVFCLRKTFNFGSQQILCPLFSIKKLFEKCLHFTIFKMQSCTFSIFYRKQEKIITQNDKHSVFVKCDEPIK